MMLQYLKIVLGSAKIGLWLRVQRGLGLAGLGMGWVAWDARGGVHGKDGMDGK